MKILIQILLTLSLCLSHTRLEAKETRDEILELRPLDVVMISLNCYVCRIIESETDSDYSHSAIVLRSENGEVMLAEALGKVKTISLQDFSARLRQGGRLSIFRAQEMEDLYRFDNRLFSQVKAKLEKIYVEKYEGLPFDKEYLWNNYDQKGREKLYCSEFVVKFLNNFLQSPLKALPMSFTRHWDAWRQIFGSRPPQGRPGMSPGDLERSQQLFFVSDL